MNKLHRQSRIKDPLWYKDAIIYEARIGSFYDSNADGIGDFPGATQKLDYLQDLGVDTLWILPFYPSPLRDDGYDISDYFSVHHHYGTLADFKRFIDQAHERGLNVVTELVLNHTSDQHHWFQRARHAKPGTSWRNFYVWSQDPNKYQEVRIIFKDYERSNWTWDEEAGAYYWHRFYSHQPDLNYDNPAVCKAVLEIVDFWLELGVDGMRLDTIPYLYEREGTSCENLPETHAFIKKLRQHIDRHFDHRMLLAEANQWPSEAVSYFGKGDECHMAFHFPIMPRLFMSIQLEDSFPLIDILQQTPAIPENTQWALFLRNHDELTLEMVTDEERDYMYATYAQDPQARLNLGIRRRLAPLLGNDRRKMELMNGILFSFPGTPIIYYADEIGMGDNIYLGDRDGVRTPMQWSPDLNAGFSKANPQRLSLPIIMDPEYSYETVNVENQQKNPNSLLWWMKRLIGLRKRFKVFGRGTIEFLSPRNPKILAFIRRYQDELILVVANFSRFTQYVELNLSEFKGCFLYELFGRTRFPSIGELPYFLTLGPYAFYWFALQLEQQPELFIPIKLRELPIMEVPNHWREIFHSPFRTLLEKQLLLYLRRFPWFKDREQPFKNATIEEKIPIRFGSSEAFLIFLKVGSDIGRVDTYVIPVTFTIQSESAAEPESLEAFIAHLHIRKKSQKGILLDAFSHPLFFGALLHGFLKRKLYKGLLGDLVSIQDEAFKFLSIPKLHFESVRISHFNHLVLNISFNQDWYLRIYRHVETRINPEVEVGRFLTRQEFPFVPPAAGVMEYRQQGKQPYTFGFLQKYIVNQGSAFQQALDEIDRYFDRIMLRFGRIPEAEIATPILDKMWEGPSPVATELIGAYLERARMIGEVTAKMHLAFAQDIRDPNFAPQVATPFYLRSNYQSKRNLAVKAFRELEQALPSFIEPMKSLVEKVIALKETIISSFESILHPKDPVLLIRGHGSYHLGHLLFTGKDFIIIGAGENGGRSFEERRHRRPAIQDVVSMLRSFHRAVFTSFFHQKQKGLISASQFPTHEQWPLFWQGWVSAVFIREYLKTIGPSPLIQKDILNLRLNANAYLIQEAIKDLIFELNQQNFDWLAISLQWLLSIKDRYETILSLQKAQGGSSK